MAEQMVQERTEQRRSPLQTAKGATHVDNSVVAKVAGVAAQEIEGVQMGGGASRAIGGIVQRVTGSTQAQQGVSVEVGEVETAIDMTLAIEYGKQIPQVTEAVRRNVIDRVENLVGLRVTEVNVTVDNIYFPEGQAPQALQDQDQQQEQQSRVR